MLIGADLSGLTEHEMKLVAARQADFNGKVVATPEAMQMLQPGNLGAAITLDIATEGHYPDGTPCQVQVWLLGSTSAIPVNQR